MKTLFVQAPFERFDLGQYVRRQPAASSPPGTMLVNRGGVAYGASMGQFEDPYLTQAERDKLLAEIQAAVKLVKPIEDMMAWSGDNDPQLRNMLGSDWTRFSALSNSIAPLYRTVAYTADNMAQTDAEYWVRPRAEEFAEIKQWTTGIQEMYRILQAHKTPAKPLPLTSKPPPSTTPAGAVTVMPRGGALTSTGPSTTDYLIAGGVAVGLGTLIYVLFG